METLNFGGFMVRFAFALLLVLLSFNPSGWSYAHWLKQTLPDITSASAVSSPTTALLALSGLLLAGGWIVYVRATMRSLGAGGVLFAVMLAAALIWLFVAMGWLELTNSGLLTWIGLVITAFVLALGMSWSHVRRRLSGQADVDDVER